MIKSLITYKLIDHSLDLMFDRIECATGTLPTHIESSASVDVIKKWIPLLESDIGGQIPIDQWLLVAESLNEQQKYNFNKRVAHGDASIEQFYLPIIRRFFGDNQPLTTAPIYSPMLHMETNMCSSEYEVEDMIRIFSKRIHENGSFVAGLHFRSNHSKIFIYW